MDRLDAEGKLDVVGRVLKFMDERAAAPVTRAAPRRASRGTIVLLDARR